MEFINKDKARYVTFQKRKKGLEKKTYELKTLCDVEVCLIIYGPKMDERLTELEIWPQTPDVIQHSIRSYRNQSNEDRKKRTLVLSNFFEDRNQKIEEALVKLRKRNDEATYSTWDDRYNDLSKEQLREFEYMLEQKLRDVKGRVAFIKGINERSQSHTKTTQNQSYFMQGLFGTKSKQLEDIYEQKPCSMQNWHEVEVPFHYPLSQGQDHIHQGLQLDSNSMANPMKVVPLMPINNYSELGGFSSSNPLYNPLERQICYDSTMCGMLDNISNINNNPSTFMADYCSLDIQAMPLFAVPEDDKRFVSSMHASHMDWNYKERDLQMRNQK
ncbi:hypothetical protein U1Q18_034412 [Sarracenia purpurea var. burkii]